jgi:hypothetical protein
VRDQLEKQCRKGEIEDENIEPGERVFIAAPDAPGQITQKYQAEERQGETGNLHHVFSPRPVGSDPACKTGR